MTWLPAGVRVAPPRGDDGLESTLLPTQLVARSGDVDPLIGVKTLMVAVLEDAIACLRSREVRDPGVRRRGRDALAWILAEDRTLPFGFGSICDSLGIDADRLRSALAAMSLAGNLRGAVSRSHRVERRRTSVVASRRRPQR